MYSGCRGCEHIRIELENIPVGRDYDIILYRNLATVRQNVRFNRVQRQATQTNRSTGEREEAASDDDGRFYIKVYSAGGYSCDDNYLLRVDGLSRTSILYRSTHHNDHDLTNGKSLGPQRHE